MATSTIKHHDIKTRDYLMVRIIQGATKSAIHVDRRKRANREACRGRSWRKETL